MRTLLMAGITISTVLLTASLVPAHEKSAPVLTNNPDKGVYLLSSIPVQGMPDKEIVLVRVELEPGAKSGDRTHPEARIFFVAEGEVRHQVNGFNETLKAGDRVTLPAFSTHRLANLSTTRAVLLLSAVRDVGTPLHTCNGGGE